MCCKTVLHTLLLIFQTPFLNMLIHEFFGGSDAKESTCNAGELGLIPGLARSPGGGNGKPLQYSCLENSYGQRSLVGYSPWGHKESGITEWLSTAHGLVLASRVAQW